MPPSVSSQIPIGTTSAGAAIALTSPLDYQVFQRNTALKGTIEIGGRAQLPPGRQALRVEARLSGASLSGPLPDHWTHLHIDRASGNFSGVLHTIPGGFYQLQVRLLSAHQTIAETSIPHVGLGEVFVVSGQSNSTNYGEVRQQTQTGMVVNFTGDTWRLADDPELGVQDHSTKGSFMPSFGDDLYRKYHVPIAVAPVGHGSTSVRQWLPKDAPVDVMPTMTRFVTRNAQGELVSDGTLFDGMMQRIHQLGKHGFRALLWHQGESDAHQAPEHSISADQYRAMMIELIRAAHKSAGWNFPWFVAEATYNTPSKTVDPALEEAQRSLWVSHIALQGPDTDTLGSQYRQNQGAGVHFSNAGLKAHGALWAHAVEHYLDTVLHR